MSDQKRIYYTYKSIEAWKKYDEKVREIIVKDAGTDVWIYNRALPPTGYPPALSPETIKKLKDLSEDVVIEEVQDD
ncbi:uncharacterized protein BO80DRAFT_151979 [Aspergillus ibericus CBS 121593]|uniref:Uncharacterized protein n=1 Tax=Aspergillus ibericus CBS 121593 TaxID=1448316 RepID=A0A395GVR3_9EURO|nr:hypothetical protein BO80DRAFT_151979 [Aspergillus ibericus CBS 121593]RAK98777.1 hypothetical protein BO80DRAFT_151979 [Aspergillus ibericus CBS 121593]